MISNFGYSRSGNGARTPPRCPADLLLVLPKNVHSRIESSVSARRVALTGTGSAPRPAQAWMIEVPWTVIFTAASGRVAGPFTTEPLTALYLLP